MAEMVVSYGRNNKTATHDGRPTKGKEVVESAPYHGMKDNKKVCYLVYPIKSTLKAEK